MKVWASNLKLPRTWPWLVQILSLVWLIWGCAAKPEMGVYGSKSETVTARGGLGISSRMSSAKMAMAEASTFKLADTQSPASMSPPPMSPPSPLQQNAPVQGKTRMVFYSGQATLRSTDPEKVLDSAIGITKLAGGYLENRSGLYATLRVPAVLFDSLFQRIMRLGEVISFDQSAQDITAAYQDADLRLQLVLATLERLEALVQKARTDAQKLQLLGQLKQLREEREVLEANKRALSRQASFASITLSVQGHTPGIDGEGVKNDIADFQWIHRLGPFDDTRFSKRKTQAFTTPEGMVVSQKRRPWRATASQGAEFWGSSLLVNPLGDARFWSEAVRLRLKDGFKAVDTLQSGDFRFCKFQSYGASPYFYWVGVNPKARNLQIVELYFPTEAQQNQHLTAILAAVQKGPVAWFSVF